MNSLQPINYIFLLEFLIETNLRLNSRLLGSMSQIDILSLKKTSVNAHIHLFNL